MFGDMKWAISVPKRKLNDIQKITDSNIEKMLSEIKNYKDNFDV